VRAFVATLAVTIAITSACSPVYRPAELRTALDQHAPSEGQRMLDGVLGSRDSGRDVGRLRGFCADWSSVIRWAPARRHVDLA
jgi:hypothetical protein